MYGVGFNFGWQEQAANDYVVLYTNPRGSSGYGSAFGNQIMRAYPSKDYDDLMAGVDEMLKKGFVDERNMFVTGCSGGGVLTAWVVGHTDRFAAASSNCPVIDWVSFVGTTDGIGLVSQLREVALGGSVRAPPPIAAHLRRQRQDTDDADDRRELDLRTPMPQTEQFYSALALSESANGHGPLRQRIPWHDEHAVQFHSHATDPAALVRAPQPTRADDHDLVAAAVEHSWPDGHLARSATSVRAPYEAPPSHPARRTVTAVPPPGSLRSTNGGHSRGASLQSRPKTAS